MVSVSRSTIIDAPISKVWEILRDFNGHDGWHPAVRKSVIDNNRRTSQVGVIRNFVLESGERLREQLLSLSDHKFQLKYAIVESEVPLLNYVAEINLKPVTDGNKTFWSWKSQFNTPSGREKELADLVAEGVYDAGFSAVMQRLKSSSQRSFSAKSGIECKSVVLKQYGDTGNLSYETTSAPDPERNEVRIKQTAIGVNFIDIYCRTGYFDLVKPPGILGMEAAGVVADVGSGVSHLKLGQRVGYACPPTGAYTSMRTMNADLVIPLPSDINDKIAAAGLLKGITADFLLHKVTRVQHQDTVLVYAPAGGVGKILCQWARHLGATVIGATSTEVKGRQAREAGAHHVVLPGPESLEEQVLKITNGAGVDYIFDAVGKDSFPHSIAALKPCGHIVSFGQASGDIGPWDIGSLAAKSVTLSRPNYSHYTDTRQKILTSAERLFSAIRQGHVSIDISNQFALQDAVLAHQAIESRQTTGSTILIPEHQG